MNLTSANHSEQIDPLRGLVEAYGFVPNLFVLQKELPRVIEGEQRLIDAILVREYALSRWQKDWLIRIVASARSSEYCRTLHARTSGNDGKENPALLAFALKLAKQPAWVCGVDVETLRVSGFGDS